MSVINTNITSMIGQQNLNKSQNALQTSMERLSSGLRINSAKDDAAGQAIANRMTAQITGLAQAQRNANDGISVAQTAEGALNQINDNLQRIRELSVQAQNGTNSSSDLESIQNEITQRQNEINRISEETNFNGTKVLASDQGLKIQVGSNDGEAITIDLKQIDMSTLGLSSFSVAGLSTENFTNIDGNAGTIENTSTSTQTTTLNAFVQPNSYTDPSPTSPSSIASAVYSYEGTVDIAAVDFDLTGAALTGSEGVVSYTAADGSTAYAILDNTTTPTTATALNVNADGTVSRGDDLSADNTAALASTTTVADGDTVDGVEVDLTGAALTGSEGVVSYTAADGSTAYAILDNTTTPNTATALNVNADGTVSRGDDLSADNTAALASTTTVADGDEFTAATTAPATLFAVKAEDGNFYAATANDDGTFTWDSYYTNDVTTDVNGDGGGSLVMYSESTVALGAFDTGGAPTDADIDTTQVFKRNDIAADDLESGYAVFDNATGNYYAATVDLDSGGVTVTDQLVSQGNVDTAGTDQIVTARNPIDINDDVYRNPLPEATGNVFALNGNSGYVVEAELQQQDGTTTTVYYAGTVDEDGNVSWDSSAGTVDAGDVNTAEALSQVDYTVTTTTTESIDVEFSGIADDDSLVSYVDDGGNTQYLIKSVDGNGNESFFKADVNLDQDSADFGAVTYDKTDAESQVAVKTDDPLAALDVALSKVDALRSDLGAIQNRFESAITNLSTNETNLAAARSRIEDADYAVEVANMTRAQILQQAGTSVLAQANQIPQNVLSLLG